MNNNLNDILVVDLDGTLLKSDMLYESFWSAFGNNWLEAIMSFSKVRHGKAKFKEYLCSKADIDIKLLPFDEDVISYIRKYQQKGGRTALVTASNQIFATKISEHLKIFNEAHGSSGENNLKGTSKATFLINQFGDGTFSYMGDAEADLPVWKVSNKIITVNASRALCRKVELLGKPVECLVTKVNETSSYIKALRLHQWSKNSLVFLPMLAAHQLNALTIISSLLAFIAFSLVASSVYIFNDLIDLSADRAHPEKKSRSFASGSLPISHGPFLAIILLIGGGLIAAYVGWLFFFVLTAYYFLTLTYSLLLKQKVIADICLLAGLYTIRVVAGGSASHIEISLWLLAFCIFIFFSLASVKRQTELVDMKKRKVAMAKGRGYHVDDLLIISIISLVAGHISVLVLALYISSPTVTILYNNPSALWAVSFILLYWITRMVFITHRGNMNNDPIVFAVTDRTSQMCFAIAGVGLIVGAVL